MVHADSNTTSPDKTRNIASLNRLEGHHFCTENQPLTSRLEWLREVIGKEYANVEISPQQDIPLFNDMTIYPWQQGMRLSPIHSNALKIERLSAEPTEVSQDCYFAVVLTSGQYTLKQAGREVLLHAGEMALYDATEPHSITMPESFSKILISIPRTILKQRLHNINQLTAIKIPTKSGVGAITSSLIQTTVNQLDTLGKNQFLELSDPILDMLTLSLNQLKPSSIQLSDNQQLALLRVKHFIQQHYESSDLDPKMISAGVNLSIRYINNLFNKEDTSLMRFLTQYRLESSKRLLNNSFLAHKTITELAMQSGFNNMAHFSRIFKQHYGLSPRQYRTLKNNHFD